MGFPPYKLSLFICHQKIFNFIFWFIIITTSCLVGFSQTLYRWAMHLENMIFIIYQFFIQQIGIVGSEYEFPSGRGHKCLSVFFSATYMKHFSYFELLEKEEILNNCLAMWKSTVLSNSVESSILTFWEVVWLNIIKNILYNCSSMMPVG